MALRDLFERLRFRLGTDHDELVALSRQLRSAEQVSLEVRAEAAERAEHIASTIDHQPVRAAHYEDQLGSLVVEVGAGRYAFATGERAAAQAAEMARLEYTTIVASARSGVVTMLFCSDTWTYRVRGVPAL